MSVIRLGLSSRSGFIAMANGTIELRYDCSYIPPAPKQESDTV